MNVQELRIHGVSGTPAGAMLGLDPVVVDDAGTPREGYGPDGVQVFRAPAATDADAFSWGGLTSGGWWKALWLLLLPFVLINAAGWTLQPTTRGGDGVADRLRIAVLRAAAVLATVLTVQLTAVALVDVVAWQWLRARFPLASGDVLWPRVGVVAVLVLIAALWYFNRVRAPGVDRLGGWDSPIERRFDDPAMRVRLETPGDPLWTHAGLIQRLRSSHGSAALGALALAAGLMGEGVRWNAPTQLVVEGDPLLLSGGLTVIALSVLLVVWRSVVGRQEPRGFETATSVVGWASVLVAIATVVLIAPRSPGDGRPFTSLRVAAVLTALVYAGAVLGVLLVAEFAARRRGRHRPVRASVVATTLGMLGLAVIGAGGSSAEMLLANWANGGGCLDGSGTCRIRIGEGAFALAVTYGAGVVTLLLTAAVWFLVVRRQPWTRSDGSVNMQVLRHMLTRPATWFGWVLALGVVGMVVAATLWQRDRGIATTFAFGGPTPWIISAVVWSVPVAAVAWVLAVELRPRVRWLAATVIAAGIAIALSGLGPHLPFVPGSPREAVLWVGLIGPVTTLLLKAWGGIRSANDRRQLGILWDLGLFWPRWYHPFTPPTYSDVAVREFRRQIRRRVGGEDDRLIVSAHSQGTVIAVAALATMTDHELAKVALVTYGAPVGRLYAELFGPSVDRQVLERVRAGLTGSDGVVRWRNLHRCTDPIGGPIVAEHQDWLGDASAWAAVERTEHGSLADLPDPGHQGHSGYQFTPEYDAAVAELRAAFHSGSARAGTDGAARDVSAPRP